ncbi:MAG: hypothetical protein KGZ25_02455 [Planctomycetes bacterium]|nr:hypothetical protein [Planctomycetota bacterium]
MSDMIAKTVLSVLVVAGLLILGVMVAFVRPFHVLAGFGGPDEMFVAGKDQQIKTEDSTIPIPPETKLTFRTRAKRGNHYRYLSHLSVEGLQKFYVEQMPKYGWKQDPRFERAKRHENLPQVVLSFQGGGKRCIIGLELSGPFETALNVVIVRAGTELSFSEKAL